MRPMFQVSSFPSTVLSELLLSLPKTATGAIEHVPIARVTNLSQTLDKLKDEGFWTFGTDMNGTPCHKWNTKGKSPSIIGNEGKGNL